jgi:transcriptional regulator with XRE-family HTH domain
MARPIKIHSGKTPIRSHYIAEWAEKRAMTQADLVRALGADKSTVSRWFDGVIPSSQYLEALAGYLGAEDVPALFRHPDDDWMLRLLREHLNPEERERAKTLLKAAFPARAKAG